jgi:hypothetical protein
MLTVTQAPLLLHFEPNRLNCLTNGCECIASGLVSWSHPSGRVIFHLHAPLLISLPPMSAVNQTAGPSQTNSFTAIFHAATSEYQRVTGNLLDDHPFSAQLVSCDSPEAVSNVLRMQAQAFSKFRKGDEKLMAWLDPIVHILFTFSGTLGEGIGLVSSLV